MCVSNLEATNNNLGIGDTKTSCHNSYIIRVIIMIIDIIMTSLNSTTATKIVKTKWKYFTDVHVSEH